MATPREHIEEIRRKKFSIGVEEENPLNEDLHHAVRHLSVELYSKDVHFLMELIQNAEDNEYPDDEVPTLAFVITSKDITGVGAPATLLVFNNEKGFSKQNIESLCSVGRSTKKGKRNSGYIGEKGIGFKSVFLISKHPHVFSDGYQIKFSETSLAGVKLGYIVPEWVEFKTTLEDVNKIYGENNELPKTTLILPLRDEKVDTVRKQLNNLHPEVILFMSKIRKLSVRDADKDPLPESVRQVSVSRETAFGSCRDEKCDSFILHLSSEEMDENNEKGYYMWRQRFPVEPENRVEQRSDVVEWTITLAFPMDDRLTRASTESSKTNAGIYAFLPTEMVTGFPFIIQADFIVSSSRESIIFDNKWNKGIIECVPKSFCKAFLSLLESEKSAPSISKSGFFKYLPIATPYHQEFISLRDSIREMLMYEHIIFCESLQYSAPAQAYRILPSFREFIENVGTTDDVLDVYRTSGQQIVHSSMENSNRNIQALDFFNVGDIHCFWYTECFRNKPNLVPSLSEESYVKLLCFLSECSTDILTLINSLPIIKYVNGNNSLGWTSLNVLSAGVNKIYITPSPECVSWLEKWSHVLGRSEDYHFMPEATQSTIRGLERRESSNLLSWLSSEAKITELCIYGFSEKLANDADSSSDKRFIVRVAQFFFFSYQNNYLSVEDALRFCRTLPVVSSTGKIIANRWYEPYVYRAPPKSISRLNKLLGNNWHLNEKDVVNISELYLQPPSCASGLRGHGSLKGEFLNKFLQVEDIPELAPIGSPSNGLDSLQPERALMLLEWVQTHFPRDYELKKSLCEQKWLKTYRGFQPPMTCLLFQSEWETSAGITCKDLNFLDQSFYEKPLINYKKALEFLGVKVKFGKDCCDLVIEQIEFRTDLSIITKLYSFLHRFKWIGQRKLKVWIPSSNHSGEWADAKSCVVSDNEGMFSHKLKILGKYYQEELLSFFTNCMGVSTEPTLEEYCKLWTEWASKDHKLSLYECCCVWKKIVKYWAVSKDRIRQQLHKGEVKLPATKSNGQDIELKSALEVYIPDNLRLKNLLTTCTSSVYFAWYPNRSESGMPVDELFSIYGDLGAKHISSAVKRSENSLTGGCVKKPTLEKEGLFSTGMYKTILAFLAEPAKKMSPETRHEILKTLFDCAVYESEEPFMVEYELPLNGNLVKATSESHVKFDKDAHEIFIHKNSDSTNKLAIFKLTNEFAEVISSELLSGHSPEIVSKLQELLRLGGSVDFQEEVIDFMLCDRNLQLFAEDTEFLESMSMAKAC